MRPTIRLGRVVGIPVGAHWSVLVIVVLVAQVLATSVLPHTVKDAASSTYWGVGIAVAIALLLSLIAHEAAHAVMAVRRGMQVKSITIWMLGGVTELEEEPPDARTDLLVALAGPLTSLACAGVAGGAAFGLAAADAPKATVAGLVWLAATNVLLAVFNMLPGAPLDGGRVLRAIVWRRTGDRRRAEMTATRTGRATGFALVGLGVLQSFATADVIGGLWLMLIGWFLYAAATAEMQMTIRTEALDDITVESVMETDVTVLPSYQDVAVAARRAVDAGAEICPVCDAGGDIVGLVAVERLVRAAVSATRPTRVGEVAVPARPTMFAAPEERIVDALRRAGNTGLLLVMSDGRLVGLVTPADVDRATRRGLVGAGAQPDG